MVSTYSIVACDLELRHWGVAVQSKFLAAGALVPWAQAEVGALATQASARPGLGEDGLALLREGRSAQEAATELVSAEQCSPWQFGIVDAAGDASSFTGKDCIAWAGGRSGAGFAVQGNILVSEDTVQALATSFERSPRQPLAERLLDALDAAQLAGGDRRGQQSAGLMVVGRGGGYGGGDTVADLRVDDHPHPLDELRRLYGLHQTLFGKTAPDQWIRIDPQLADELGNRLARKGFTGDLDTAIRNWANIENLEERLVPVGWIDPVVLRELRRL